MPVVAAARLGCSRQSGFSSRIIVAFELTYSEYCPGHAVELPYWLNRVPLFAGCC